MKNDRGGASIGFCGLLSIILIVLKVLGHITLAWKWIILLALAPWIILLIFLVFIVIIAILSGGS